MDAWAHCPWGAEVTEHSWIVHLRSCRRHQDSAKNRLPNPHLIVSVAQGPEVLKVWSINKLSALRVKPNDPSQCKSCQRFVHTQHNLWYVQRCVGFEGIHPSFACSATQGQPQCCSYGGDTRRTMEPVWSEMGLKWLLKSGCPVGEVRALSLATLVRKAKLDRPGEQEFLG
jgi:hypothetical protein